MKRYRQSAPSLFEAIEERKQLIKDCVFKLSIEELRSDSLEIVSYLQQKFCWTPLELDIEQIAAIEHGNKEIEISPRDSRFFSFGDEDDGRPAIV